MDDLQTLENDVAIADAGPSRKKLTITIPPEAIDRKLAESLDTIALEASLPGFRKGRAPRSLLERRFGEAVRSEAKTQLISQAYTQAVETHKLKVVGDPTGPEGDVEIARGKPLSFEVEVEVMPEFDVPEFEGLAIDKPLLEVGDEMVAEEKRRILVNEGRLESLQAPTPGDYVTGHAVMTDADGTEHYNIEGAVIQLPEGGDRGGRGMILGLMVDDLGSQAGLPKPGETFTVTTTGPAQHEIEAIRGADLTITFRVERADRIVPADIAEIIQRFGLEDEEQFTSLLRDRMEQRVRVEQLNVMHQQVARQLVDRTDMTLPESLTAAQAQRIIDRKRIELTHRGFEPAQVEEAIAELRAGSAAAATHDLKLLFLLNAIAEKLDISVSEGEINGRIAQLAASRQVRPEAMRQELIKANRIGAVAQQIREHKTMGAIVDKATITELPAAEFNAAHA